MYKGKTQLFRHKLPALKRGRAVGRSAGASFLCLFPIPWPEAMVCIFRTTAGYEQAGDLSSGFITTYKMTRASLWSPTWLAECIQASASSYIPPPLPSSEWCTHWLPRLQLCDSLGLIVTHCSCGKTGFVTTLFATVWLIYLQKTRERDLLAGFQGASLSLAVCPGIFSLAPSPDKRRLGPLN